MSVASLYRPPFGKAVLAAIISRITNAKRQKAAKGEANEALILDEDFSLRGQRAKIPYAERKAAFARRREAKARHFLCWIGFDRPGLGGASSLYLIHESQVPEELRPGYRAQRRRLMLPDYSHKVMSAILTRLSQDAPSIENKHRIGSVIQTGAEGFAWECVFGGIIAGQEVSFEKAMQEVLRHVQPNRTRRRIIILNPYLNGRYEVPEWRQNLNQIGEQKD
jgi:hypothetical protein